MDIIDLPIALATLIRLMILMVNHGKSSSCLLDPQQTYPKCLSQISRYVCWGSNKLAIQVYPDIG